MCLSVLAGRLGMQIIEGNQFVSAHIHRAMFRFLQYRSRFYYIVIWRILQYHQRHFIR